MSVESFENIISLFCTIAGLLYCVFRYTEGPMRAFRFLIVYYLSSFLSEYYWTVYELVMHVTPNVSEFTAYLGWNVGYLVLLLAVFCFRKEQAKRFFHPVILLPVLLNTPQFLLYVSFGGFLNNLWEVGTSTLTMVFCLQEVVYDLKNRETVRKMPSFSLLVLIFLTTTYGMWTASCFEWNSDLSNPYLYCSVINSLVSVFFTYGAEKYYASDHAAPETKSAPELRFQVLVQIVASLVVIIVCTVGFLIAIWMKNTLPRDDGLYQDEGQLVVWLFAISALLIFLVLGLIYLFTSRYRHTIERIRKMDAWKLNRFNLFLTIVVTLLLMASGVVYNSMTLYTASVVSVYEDGEEAIKTTATELENYLTVATTTLRIAADSVDIMEQNGSSIADITHFLMDQTERQAHQFDQNFTGLYAYVNGQYLDGLGWEPPEGYEATERDWYKKVIEGHGEIVIVPPYVDAQTKQVVITIGKQISGADSEGRGDGNVVCLDVIVNHIQELVQEVEIAGKGYGMVVNDDGFIIAHRESEYNGRNVAEVYGQELLDSILNTQNGKITAKVNGEDCTLFLSPVIEQWYSVIVIRDAELLADTYSQLAVNIMVSFVVFCLITFFYYVGYKNEQIYGRKVEEMNIQVVSALASAIDAKDKYTNGHSARVAAYSRMLAARSGCSKSEQDEIYMMALLHDVGKIGVPDYVINKPSKLTEEEYELIKKHPAIGSAILASIKEKPNLATGARWHHERYGGGGYPDGIAGEKIPKAARIIAVADTYDAMTSRRSYRDVMPQNKVRSEIKEGMGTQFDPQLAKLMLQMIDEDRNYTMREQ